MVDHAIHFRCDNIAVVQVINLFSPKFDQVMKLVRVFTLKCLRLNLLFLAWHVSVLANGIADALSQKQMVRFHQLAQGADVLPAWVPGEFWKI